jgi:hypothetical protein
MQILIFDGSSPDYAGVSPEKPGNFLQHNAKNNIKNIIDLKIINVKSYY